jgi:hypothetical protein
MSCIALRQVVWNARPTTARDSSESTAKSLALSPELFVFLARLCFS